MPVSTVAARMAVGAASTGDEVSGLFCGHDDRGIDVAANEIGHDRGIGDAETLYAVQPKLAIDDRVGVAAHAAGTAGMMGRCRRGADIGVELDVAAMVVARRRSRGRGRDRGASARRRRAEP